MTLTMRQAYLLALDSAVDILRNYVDTGGALPQSAHVPVEWPRESREYNLIASALRRIADSLDERAATADKRLQARDEAIR